MTSHLESLGHTVVKCSRRTGVDVADRNTFESAAKGSELVFHLAADVRPAGSLLTPWETFETNSKMTANVALTCKDLGIPIIYASSCEIYGDSDFPITEESPIMPTNPYSASKAACDRLLYAFHRCYGLDVKITRLFNSYGPHQQLNKIIPTFYKQARAGKPITVYGDGSDTRDYVYVDDIVKGLWHARRLSPGEAVNIATNIRTTTAKVAQMLKEKTNSNSEIVHVPYPEVFGGIKRQIGSAQKAMRLLGWKAETSLEEGLGKTIDWLDSLDAT